MAKGLFDDIFDDKDNRLIAASKLADANEVNVFEVELLYLVCNTALSIWLIISHQSRVATGSSLSLLAIDVLPVAWIKIQFYQLLGKNKNNRFLGILAKIIKFLSIWCIIPILFLTVYTITTDYKLFNWVAIIGTFILALIGGLNKTIDFYINKAVSMISKKN